MNVSDIWNIVTEIFAGIGNVWSWFTTPIDFLGGLAPWMICTSGGFAIIITIWVAKLINPFS